MKLKNILEDILDIEGDEASQAPSGKKANLDFLNKKIQTSLNNALTSDKEASDKIQSVKVNSNMGQTEIVTIYKDGKSSTSTFNTSHVMKYLNNPKYMVELLLKKGYYK